MKYTNFVTLGQSKLSEGKEMRKTSYGMPLLSLSQSILAALNAAAVCFIRVRIWVLLIPIFAVGMKPWIGISSEVNEKAQR